MVSGTSGGKRFGLRVSVFFVDAAGHPGFNSALFFSPSSLRVRGQHTKTTGRRGRTVGVSKKK